LAPNNKALTPPSKRKHLDDIQPYHDDALRQLSLHADELYAAGDKDDDDKEKERKKKILKAILNAVLRYHILPYGISSTALGANSTVQTNYIPKDGSYGGYNQRIKLEKSLIPPAVTINKYAKIVKGDSAATNGVIHEIDHPLFPPPSVLQIAHLAPQWLSTFTSAVQKVGLSEGLDWHYDHSSSSFKPKFVGSPAITVFVPDNNAWKRLPERLILYLFSPIGEKALTKLLQFHVVPNYIIHAEWIIPVKSKDVDVHAFGTGGIEEDFSFPFPTALTNYSLPVHIKKSVPTLPVPGLANFEFSVLGHVVEQGRFDFVARNGAIHLTRKVLNPLKTKQGHGGKRHAQAALGEEGEDDDGWEDWEDWLPQWADEN